MGRITASRETLRPDPKYGSILASKFINCLMWSGKKSTAQPVFYGALDIIGEKIKDAEPIDVFTQAVENVKPNIEVRSKRVGGASYQVPMQVSKTRQQSLADPLDPGGHSREEGPPDGREAGRRVDGRLQARRARPTPSARTSTAWPTPTRPSPTSPGSESVLLGLHSACPTLRKWHGEAKKVGWDGCSPAIVRIGRTPRETPCPITDAGTSPAERLLHCGCGPSSADSLGEVARRCLHEVIQAVCATRPFESLPSSSCRTISIACGRCLKTMRALLHLGDESRRNSHVVLARGGTEVPRGPSRCNKASGIWQRRYWEHAVRRREDLKRCSSIAFLECGKGAMAMGQCSRLSMVFCRRYVKAPFRGEYVDNSGGEILDPSSRLGRIRRPADIIPVTQAADPQRLLGRKKGYWDRRSIPSMSDDGPARETPMIRLNRRPGNPRFNSCLQPKRTRSGLFLTDLADPLRSGEAASAFTPYAPRTKLAQKVRLKLKRGLCINVLVGIGRPVPGRRTARRREFFAPTFPCPIHPAPRRPRRRQAASHSRPGGQRQQPSRGGPLRRLRRAPSPGPPRQHDFAAIGPRRKPRNPLAPVRPGRGQGAGHWRASAWLLERRNPEDFAARSPRLFTAAQILDMLSHICEILREELPDDNCVRAMVKLEALLGEWQIAGLPIAEAVAATTAADAKQSAPLKMEPPPIGKSSEGTADKRE